MESVNYRVSLSAITFQLFRRTRMHNRLPQQQSSNHKDQDQDLAQGPGPGL